VRIFQSKIRVFDWKTENRLLTSRVILIFRTQIISQERQNDGTGMGDTGSLVNLLDYILEDLSIYLIIGRSL